MERKRERERDEGKESGRERKRVKNNLKQSKEREIRIGGNYQHAQRIKVFQRFHLLHP